jgi:pimeloyl-ACP methyl ester carboxylesterase
VFSTVTLGDRRTLEYAELGDPTGTPVLFYPGTPATAGQASVIVDAAGSHGVRLIGVSRPGYGASTLSPPSLRATATDALELADDLELERFAVLGASGGGPFALALAAVAPHRVAHVAVHAGPGSFADVMPEILGEDDHRALALVADGDVDGAMQLEGALADADFGKLRDLSDADFSAALAGMAPPGESWLDRHPVAKAAFQADFRRAITPIDGSVRDNLCWLGAWDVDLGAVALQVRLVYGESDGMSPVAHAEWLQDRLPHSELHVVPGGHGDATFGAAADTFAALAASPI